MPESKKHSLKSVALAENNTKLKYLTNSEVNKCNQQWEHMKTSEEMKTWRNEKP